MVALKKDLQRQLVEQRLRLLQIERVEAFGEPAVDRSKQFARLLHLALIAPEVSEAHGRAELPGLGLLLTRDRKRFCFKPSQSRPELVAHYVAGAAGGGKLLAEFVERGPVTLQWR